MALKICSRGHDCGENDLQSLQASMRSRKGSEQTAGGRGRKRNGRANDLQDRRPTSLQLLELIMINSPQTLTLSVGLLRLLEFHEAKKCIRSIGYIVKIKLFRIRWVIIRAVCV